MKKLLAASAISLATFGLPAGIAAAASNGGCGDISNTGPGSNNTINCTDNSDLNISCNNHVDVVFVNGQSSNSGSVVLTKNTTGGYSFSGNAVNNNSSNTGLDVSCAPAHQASQPVTPPAGGQGGGPVVQGSSTSVSQLPNTGSNDLKAAVAAATALVAAGLALAVGSAKRRLSN